MAFKLESFIRDPGSVSDLDTEKMSTMELGDNPRQEDTVEQNDDAAASANDQPAGNRPSNWNPVTWPIRTWNFLRSLRKFEAADIKDATMGTVDGITVPFVLTAGLSSIKNSKIVVMAGVAELIGGAVSMAMAAYLSTSAEEMAAQVDEEASRAIRSAVIMFFSYLIGSIIPMIPYFTQIETMKALGISASIAAIMGFALSYVMGYFSLGKKHKTALCVALRNLGIGVVATLASFWIIKGLNKRWEAC
ncbi:hypothetical protein HYALB_00007281 [Hymenoscyphus albidus]|uniref:Uncharacterized protein n=1 Tax=Hymenoscyphus albidus TaxID=595503 RepID=A0A9N9LWJ9_9HELO|nr:hypothetical protein HYALB_00007281 [Hymenoscyphus albidus]